MSTYNMGDPNVKRAIIYAIDDLFGYTVEIKDKNKSYYLTNGSEPILFNNMGDARQAAIKENVVEAYLALSKTYEETSLNDTPKKKEERFDYSVIGL